MQRDLTLGNFHDRMAELRGDRAFSTLHEPLRYTDFQLRQMSYRDAARFVEKVSSALRDLGVRPGERVGISTGNNGDLPMSIFAIARAGAVAVPMNYMLKGKEMRYIMENCGAETLIVDREVFEGNIGSKENIPSIKRWIMAGPREDNLDGFQSLDQAMSAAPDWGGEKLDPDDVVAIFYTSGTTGFPKGAVMTSRCLLTAQKIGAAVIPVGPSLSGLFCLPAAHVMGFGCYIIGACVGLGAYYMRHFEPRAVLEVMEREKIGLFVGVPAMYAMMLAEGIDSYDLSHMKMFGSAADAMPEEYAEAFRAKGNLFKLGPYQPKAFFTEVYGMVELAGIATLKIAIMGLKYPRGCVGWPLLPVRVRIVDDYGKKLPAGEVGEVAVSGPGITKGYWGNPEATAELIQDGWLRTGDVGRKDKWGRLFFVDRVKDVIKVGGYSVFSVEVEKEVLNHPDIADAAVVGTPHPLKKQVPLAVVTIKPGSQADEEDILAWCKENIAGYKSPRAVRIIKPEEMPYGMTLKVRKLELRDRFADLFAGDN
jgi:acyl-CoA synthetase (AMP-forming)/AMP-acid ligase II